MNEWPRVLPDDAGIRPAGRPDTCFYCHRKIGEEHGRDCVEVVRDVVYEVIFDGLAVGTWTRWAPFHWNENDARFWANEGTWCTSNMLDEGELTVSAEVRSALEALDDGDEDGGSCLCDRVLLEPIAMGADFRRLGHDEA